MEQLLCGFLSTCDIYRERKALSNIVAFPRTAKHLFEPIPALNGPNGRAAPVMLNPPRGDISGKAAKPPLNLLAESVHFWLKRQHSKYRNNGLIYVLLSGIRGCTNLWRCIQLAKI